MFECTGLVSTEIHGPPDGGGTWFRLASINMALLAEDECPNFIQPLRSCTAN